MQRRDVLKSALAGVTALAAPRIVHAERPRPSLSPRTRISPRLIPSGPLPTSPATSPSRSTTRCTATTPNSMCSRRWSKAHKTENDGKLWELTLRDGLAFHDGTPVLARDCVATIQRCSKRYPFGARR